MSQSTQITLEGDPCGSIEAMLRFLHHLDPDSTPVEVSLTLFSVMPYITRDKYMIPNLRSLAEEQFTGLVATIWKDDDFFTVISEVYKSTRDYDWSLRDLVLSTVHLHLDALTTKPAFRDIVREISEFSEDLIFRPSECALGSFYCSNPQCSAMWWRIPEAFSSCFTCPRRGANVDLTAGEYKTNTGLILGRCSHNNMARRISSGFDFLVFLWDRMHSMLEKV